MSRPLLVALVLAAGCGRLGFGEHGVAATDAAGATSDGPVHDGAGPPELVDLTAAAPLLTTENPLSNSCGQYLITFASYDVEGVFWHPTVVPVGDTAYFFIPCKYTDAGNWSMGLASWTPASSGPPLGAWIDGDTGSDGINEFVKPGDLASSGLAIGSLGNVAVAWDGNRLVGVGSTQYQGPAVNMPVQLGLPTSLSAKAFEVGQLGALDIAANDGTWRGASTPEHSVMFRDNTFDVFTMQNDAPAMTTPYIVVDQISDGMPTTITLAEAPLLSGASHPVVASDDANIYLISIDLASGYYQLRTAPTIDGLATATPRMLDLAQFQGDTTAWNHDLFAFTPRNEPRIFGAWAHGGALLLFYLAGDTDYTVATAPYDTPRAIGVLSLPL